MNHLRKILKKTLLFPLDVLYLTVDAWIVGYLYVRRLMLREKDQRCHFCRGEDHSEPGHPVRSALRYQNFWIVKLLAPCLRLSTKSGPRRISCCREGGYTRATALAPALALGLTLFWWGLILGSLKAASSEPDQFWANFITFINPARTLGANRGTDFLELGDARLNPERAERYFMTGVRHFDRQEFARAQVDFKIAIQSNPSDANLHYHLARSLFAMGQMVQGEASIRQALQLDANHAGSLLIMAEILERREDRAGALRHAKRALENRPDHLQSLRMVTALAASTGDLELARASADQLLALDPEQPGTLAFLGRIELNAFQDFEKGRAHLEKALELNPNHVDALLGMIPIYAQEQNLQQMEATLSQVLQIQPGHLQANQMRAEFQLSRFGPTVGIREYESLLQRFPGEPSFRLRHAELLLQNGRMSEGLRTARQLTGPRNSPAIQRNAHWLLAQVYGQIRMLDEAEEHTRQALQLSPGNRNMFLFLMQTMMQNRKFSETQLALENYLAGQPDDLQAVMLLNQVFRAQGDFNRAVAVLDSAIASHPEADLLVLRRVETLMQSPRWQESVSNARMLHERYPERPELANNLAFVLARSRQDLDFAYSLSSGLLEQHPENPGILDTHGLVLAARGDHAAAIPLFESALSQLSTNAMIRHHLALSLAESGRVEEATRHLNIVLVLDPPYSETHQIEQLIASLKGDA